MNQKTLFICHANVGRSQVAMELFRRRGGTADSAGTEVDKPGTTVGERPGVDNTLQVVKEDYQIDLAPNIRTQLTEKLARPYDHLVMITAKDTWPDWLLHDPRVTFWDIDDAKGRPLAETRRIFAEIAAKVNRLDQ